MNYMCDDSKKQTKCIHIYTYKILVQTMWKKCFKYTNIYPENNLNDKITI